jgi:hypothetical protein
LSRQGWQETGRRRDKWQVAQQNKNEVDLISWQIASYTPGNDWVFKDGKRPTK